MRPLIAAGALALALSLPASAQVGRQGGPIDITAESMELLDREGVSRWRGKVDVRQGENRLVADEVDVFYSESRASGSSEIVKIVAKGAVAYITPEEIARGDRGEYRVETDQIEMCGNVTLIQGKSTLKGECLLVEPSVGRSRIVAAKGSAAAAKPGERVRGVLYPGSVEGAAKPAAPPEEEDKPAEAAPTSGG